MTEVTFIQADGTSINCQANAGDTLLHVALDNNVAGIIGQCGGGATCCTCHAYVDVKWLVQLAPPHQDELDMLEYAWQRRDNSRLICQVPVTCHLQGIQITVPAQQA